MATAHTQREFALQVVKKLHAAGYEALWAGGCVRDQLLGLEPQDYDVATNARPEQVRALFGHRRTLAIGAAFGVIAVLGSRGQEPIEVATFRSDGTYRDGRRPAEVEFTTAPADAQRRDFTINGMFFDPLNDQVWDYVGGAEDLRQQVVRAIGDPHARFAEDKLRMLRAVRFAATLEFQLDPATLAAIQSMAGEVHVVSAERIGYELRRILCAPSRRRGMELLFQSGLAGQLLPELERPEGRQQDEEPDGWESLAKLPEISLPVALATLLAPQGNTQLAQTVGRRFRFTNQEIQRAAWLIQHLAVVRQATELPWPQLQRCLVQAGSADLLTLTAALWGDQHPGVVLCQEKLRLPAAELDPPRLISGDDLVAQGFQPGPYFAQLLELVRDAQLEKTIQTKEQALRWAQAWLSQRQQS